MFSSHAKQKLNQNEMCNLVYKYLCPCKSFYIGETKRLLQIRAHDHQTKSRNTHIYQHISTCATYIKEASEFALNYPNQFTSPKKAKVVFFKSKFSVLEKGFRNEHARKKCEAYHIKLQRPDINDQIHLKASTLF